jgi:hypothetical protein
MIAHAHKGDVLTKHQTAWPHTAVLKCEIVTLTIPTVRIKTEVQRNSDVSERTAQFSSNNTKVTVNYPNIS